MKKELCIVHANCQGAPLIERLRQCPEFKERYQCLLVTNYTRQRMPKNALANCTLFLYQHLNNDWKELASQTLLAQLPAKARSLCIPNMFFKGYWPTWSGELGFDYRCRYLDDLIKADISDKQVVMLYLRSPIQRKYNLPVLLDVTLRTERERERYTPIKYVHLIESLHKTTPLFHTVNHPGSLLMNHAAKGVLEALGFTPPNDETLLALHEPFAEFDQPIHPSVAKAYGLDFAGPDTEFQIYNRTLSFPRYVAQYVTASRAGITDFIAFLQGDFPLFYEQ